MIILVGWRTIVMTAVVFTRMKLIQPTQYFWLKLPNIGVFNWRPVVKMIVLGFQVTGVGYAVPR